MTELGRLETEGRADALADLDLWPTADVVGTLVRANRDVLAAVEAAAPAIAALADAAAARDGRIIYAGAGCRGLDRVRRRGRARADVRPRRGRPRRRLRAPRRVARGGRRGGRCRSRRASGRATLAPTARDVVIAVSASGRTRYALGALDAARAAGALTGAVACTPGSPLAQHADLAVEVPVGPEVVAGSTRMKAGTAQKLVLNAFSTAVAIRRGRTLGDLMTSMHVANDKLRDRAVRIVAAAAHAGEDSAREALAAAGDELPVRRADRRARPRSGRRPRARCEAADGNLRRALGQSG